MFACLFWNGKNLTLLRLKRKNANFLFGFFWIIWLHDYFLFFWWCFHAMSGQYFLRQSVPKSLAAPLPYQFYLSIAYWFSSISGIRLPVSTLPSYLASLVVLWNACNRIHPFRMFIRSIFANSATMVGKQITRLLTAFSFPSDIKVSKFRF